MGKLSEEENSVCAYEGEIVNQNCIHHPGALLVCLNPRISEWAAKWNSTYSNLTEANSTVSVNSSSQIINNSSSQNSENDQSGISNRCPNGYHRSPDGGCEKVSSFK